MVVGSRRSKLALTQSKQFIDKLKAIDPSLEIEIKEIVKGRSNCESTTI